MPVINIKRALIAVYDKTGIVEFARALVDEFGVEIISTGGTARHLKEAGIPVTLVEEVTGFPEMLDGRVKTLHPKIHAAILADRDNLDHMRQLAEQGIQPIDMVVVNLYPFEETIKKPHCTFEEAIEMIDIGGPCILRAAAKNHKHVLVLSSPIGYGVVLKRMGSPRGIDWQHYRRWHAYRAFWETVSYDAAIAPWLTTQINDDTPLVRVDRSISWGKLRYGENPHQTGELFGFFISGDEPDSLWPGTYGIDGKLSLNNFVDANAALDLCAELSRANTLTQESARAAVRTPKPSETNEEPQASARGSSEPGSSSANSKTCCTFIKHTNACGVGIADDPIDAYRKAYLGDPNAAMGGILAVDFNVTAEFASAVMSSLQRWGKAAGAGAFFIEVWIAPSFDDEAVQVVRTAKKWGERVRLLSVGNLGQSPTTDELDFKKITGGMLVQDCDLVGLNEDRWNVVTERTPSDAEMADLRLAWLICKHTKSNAITICKEDMLIGNGAGQMSRVMSCRIATWLANENGHADKLKGGVAASDAFFPFRDGPDILIDAGVTAIIQPGGSKRDADTIAACNGRGIAMVFTGTRHFKH